MTPMGSAMRYTILRANEYYVPGNRLTDEDLKEENSEWPMEKITAKTGFPERRIADEEECASDLGPAAAHKLFESGA